MKWNDLELTGQTEQDLDTGETTTRLLIEDRRASYSRFVAVTEDDLTRLIAGLTRMRDGLRRQPA